MRQEVPWSVRWRAGRRCQTSVWAPLTEWKGRLTELWDEHSLWLDLAGRKMAWERDSTSTLEVKDSCRLETRWLACVHFMFQYLIYFCDGHQTTSRSKKPSHICGLRAWICSELRLCFWEQTDRRTDGCNRVWWCDVWLSVSLCFKLMWRENVVIITQMQFIIIFK